MMKTRNSCYTYFKIVGNFDPDYFTKVLNIQPEKSWKNGDLRKDGTKYDFALLEIGRCTDYDIVISNQMKKTISVLIDKIDLLNKLRKENDISFYLEVVPTIYADDINPCLAPDLDVIDFCHATRTEIDIDMYVVSSDAE